MSAESKTERSGLEKFLDNFLHESSIKWMLMIGAAIVAGSSLMLVTRQWATWPGSTKYIAILSYTIATFALAELCHRRLGLRSTAEVLRLLTLVLIPISFLSLAWLHPATAGSGLLDQTTMWLLLVPAAVFMVYAGTRIFRNWLHGNQPTFVAAYMLLCLAGVLPIINTTWLAVLFSGGFWLVMTIGVVKVNRHLFWLAEEHRWPRIFGFIPVLLLGTQFVVLMMTKTMSAIPNHWLGLSFVMLAATLLATTRTIASVFRQRTGDLVRPLPWPIVAPLVTSLILIALGVSVSFIGFTLFGPTTMAVVPTALTASGLLLLVAKDTRHPGFVWVGLVLLTIAYQSCPTLVQDLVQSLKATAASSLHETRLPIAFYGLTYLPLLIAAAIASRLANDRKRSEFSLPLQHFATVVLFILVAIAMTNIKAMFLVSSVATVTLVAYAYLFRSRQYVDAALATLLLATGALVPFIKVMGYAALGLEWILVAYAVLGLLLSATKTYRTIGKAATWVVGAAWVIVSAMFLGSTPSIANWCALAIVLASLLFDTLRTKSYASGCGLWILASIAAWFAYVPVGVNLVNIANMVTPILGVVALAGYWTLRATGYREADRHQVIAGRDSRWVALVLSLADVALTQFCFAAAILYMPAVLLATGTLDVGLVPSFWPLVFAIVVAIAITFRTPIATLSLIVTAPLVAGIALGSLAPSWLTHQSLVLVYAIASVVMGEIARRIQRTPSGTLSIDVRLGAALWCIGLVAVSFVYLSPLTMLGSFVAIAGLAFAPENRRTESQQTVLAIAASMLAILSLALLTGTSGWVLAVFTIGHSAPQLAFMLLGVVGTIVLFDNAAQGLRRSWCDQYTVLLRCVGAMMFAMTFMADDLDVVHKIVVRVAVGLAAANEFRMAIKRQQEAHVVAGMLTIAALAIWMHWHRVVPVPPIMFKTLWLFVAAACLHLSQRWDSHPKLAVMARSLRIVGVVLPMFVAVASLAAMGRAGTINVAVIFGAATIWFLYGQAIKQRRYVIGAIAMANVGIAAMWISFSLFDAQLYLVPVGVSIIGLVELLRREIPKTAHEPLRYIGALAILVSPCFQILGGSWWHLLSLMVLSVIVILLAIGLRLRALIHTGTAFLILDLLAMVIRSTIDHPGMLWITGVALGAAVIALAAVCEHHREQLLSKIRLLTAELATWS